MRSSKVRRRCAAVRTQASQTICDEYPLADPRPLSAVSFEARFAPQVLRYAALVSLNDPERGREICERELSEHYRRGIDVREQSSALTGYVVGRLVRRYPRDVDVVRSRVIDLLQSVVPPVVVDPLPRQRKGDAQPSSAPGTRRYCPRPLPTSDIAREIDGSVVLIAEALYHVDELGPLHDVLQARGVKVRFMQAPQTVAPALRAIGGYTTRILPFAPELIGRSAAVVVLNDWAAAQRGREGRQRCRCPHVRQGRGRPGLRRRRYRRNAGPTGRRLSSSARARTTLDALPDRRG